MGLSIAASQIVVINKTQGESKLKPEKHQKQKNELKCFLELPPTKSSTEVPLLFREPYIDQGYRDTHRPWSYYFKSLFQLHNESMNVWTHLLAAGLMIRQLIQFNREVDFIHDVYSWPFLMLFIICITVFLCSSFAHLLQSKSETVHYTCFMTDFAGIALFPLGCTIVYLQYLSEEDFFAVVKDFFVPLGTVLAFVQFSCCSIAKIKYRRPYPLAKRLFGLVPGVILFCLLATPVIHRSYTCITDPTRDVDTYHHIRHVCWWMATVFFYTTNIPERFYPGKCNHFFASHQLYHISSMIAMLFHMDSILIDFNARSDIIRSRPESGFVNPLFLVLILAILEAVCIGSFWNHMNRKQKKQK